MAGDIFTLDADNNAAVRTVSVNAGASETNSPVIFTKDANGNAAGFEFSKSPSDFEVVRYDYNITGNRDAAVWTEL